MEIVLFQSIDVYNMAITMVKTPEHVNNVQQVIYIGLVNVDF